MADPEQSNTLRNSVVGDAMAIDLNPGLSRFRTGTVPIRRGVPVGADPASPQGNDRDRTQKQIRESDEIPPDPRESSVAGGSRIGRQVGEAKKK